MRRMRKVSSPYATANAQQGKVKTMALESHYTRWPGCAKRRLLALTWLAGAFLARETNAQEKYLLRLKLKPGDRLTYAYKVHLHRPAFGHYIEELLGQKGRTWEQWRQGSTELLVMSREPGSHTIVCSTESHCTRSVIDDERDVTAETVAAWHRQDLSEEWRNISCWSWHDDGVR